MKVQVLPPDEHRTSVSIDISLIPRQISFLDVDQSKNATVDFMAVALDKTLKRAGAVSNTVDATLQPERYQSILKAAFPGHLDLELKAGNYVLRVGAIDRNSQKIGTVDVPLNIPAETTQK